MAPEQGADGVSTGASSRSMPDISPGRCARNPRAGIEHRRQPSPQPRTPSTPRDRTLSRPFQHRQVLLLHRSRHPSRAAAHRCGRREARFRGDGSSFEVMTVDEHEARLALVCRRTREGLRLLVETIRSQEAEGDCEVSVVLALNGGRSPGPNVSIRSPANSRSGRRSGKTLTPPTCNFISERSQPPHAAIETRTPRRLSGTS